jgi:hypothetical protein
MRSLQLLALLAIGLAAGACKQSDSILLVLVYGPQSLDATQLSVTIFASPDTHNIPVAPSTPGASIRLPASFTISLDRSYAAPITISIDALDASGSIVGFGTTMMQHIQVGGQTDIAITLNPGLPPDMLPDGGAGGAGGGAAGQGGGAGMDAAAGGGGAMGLDGATD